VDNPLRHRPKAVRCGFVDDGGAKGARRHRATGVDNDEAVIHPRAPSPTTPQRVLIKLNKIRESQNPPTNHGLSLFHPLNLFNETEPPHWTANSDKQEKQIDRS